MSLIDARPRATVAMLAGAVAFVTVACGSSRDGGGGAMSRLANLASRSGRQDPCTLLSADEAVPYVGTLATPPYRANDGSADVRGTECTYRGTDGRTLAIKPSRGGGQMMAKVMRDVPNVLGGVLGRGADSGLDTMVHRVLQQGPAGPWDQATWIPGGSLFVTKGDVMVVVDVSGASGSMTDALAIAKALVPRIGNPLDYDGAKAVAAAPQPRAHPRNACDVVPRAAVEAAIGTLASAPTPAPDGTSCTYTVAASGGERAYPVAFTWEGGGKNYNMLKHSMAMASGMLGTPGAGTLDAVKPNGDVGAMIGGLMKLAGGKANAANGAASTVGFRTDTTLKGPWDSASLLHGTQLIAVKHDVFVVMDLQSADYDRAKALLAAICTRL